MATISSRIKVDLTTTSQATPYYQTYNVYLRGIEGNDPYKLVYVGRVYVPASTTKVTIYLNDVLRDNGTGYSYFLDAKAEFVNTNLILDWAVTSSGYDYEGSVYYYDLPIWKTEPTSEPNSHLELLLAQTTSKVPRVPAIRTAEMFIGLVVNQISHTPTALWTEDRLLAHYSIEPNTFGYIFYGEDIRNLFVNEATLPSSLWIGTYTEKVTKIAELLPACQSDYYLSWIDRTGGWNCQPFDGRYDFSEQFKTETTTNLFKERRPMRKEVSGKWSLNTKFLTEEDYKMYEPILWSKYLYLYDVRNDKGFYVIVTNTTYNEKLFKNEKGLFTFGVEVEMVEQIITNI
jgi:hypothetical protein